MTLPVRYRIDNRWLFADISDELEPEVIEVDFSQFKSQVNFQPLRKSSMLICGPTLRRFDT